MKKLTMLLCATFFYYVIIIFFLSCKTMNVDDNQSLKRDEGYLLFSVEAKALKWELSLFNSNNINSIFGMAEAMFQFDSEKKFIFIKLNEGKYSIKYIYNKPFAFELDTYFFDIQPGVINYIGNLNINVLSDDPYSPEFNYYYTDNKNEALKFLKVNYPNIESINKVVDDSIIHSPLFLIPKQWM